MPIEVTGHAIVSTDGMIAGPDGGMPPALRNDADWRRFQAALDASALVVLGRLGHLAHPNPGRRRLVVTSGVDELVADAGDPNALLWNPAGIGFDAVLARLRIADGGVAVTGGTRVFDLFLPRFTRFDLALAHGVRLPGGRPCFSDGPPEQVLAQAGLRLQEQVALDTAVTLSVWQRPPADDASRPES